MFFQEPVIEKQKPILNIPALAGTKDAKKVSKTSTIQAIEAKLKTMEEASSSFYLELDKKPSNLQKRKYSPCNKSNVKKLGKLNGNMKKKKTKH